MDEGQLRHLFHQLQADGERLEVSFKRRTDTAPEPAELEELILPLVKRKVFGAQVHYRAGGRLWLDTFIATRRGVRVVRLLMAS